MLCWTLRSEISTELMTGSKSERGDARVLSFPQTVHIPWSLLITLVLRRPYIMGWSRGINAKQKERFSAVIVSN